LFSFGLDVLVDLKRMPLLSGLGKLFPEEGFTDFRSIIGLKGVSFEKQINLK